jgi:CRISPR-associated protein Csd1
VGGDQKANREETMILQALIKYAEQHGLGDVDFAKVHVRWLIPLTESGALVNTPIELIEVTDEGRSRLQKLTRPYTSPDQLSHHKANFLCDTLERAVTFPNRGGDARPECRRLQHEHFKALLREAADCKPLAAKLINAALTLLESPTELKALHRCLQKLKAKPTDNVTFQINGVNLLHNEDLQQFWSHRRKIGRDVSNLPRRVCLATGEWTETLKTSEPIKGVPGGLPTGARLVSFDKPAFCSFNLIQGENAPISPEAEVKIRRALEDLIHFGHRIGDSIWVHWANLAESHDLFRTVVAAEKSTILKLLEVQENRQARCGFDPEQHYLLRLSANGGRIIVRSWLATNGAELEQNARQWFTDLAIVQPDGKDLRFDFKIAVLLYALVRSDLNELPPQLPPQLLLAALSGAALSSTILARAIHRAQIEAAQEPNLARLALIKGCLLRNAQSPERKVNLLMNERIDPKCQDPAYLCGRLFAVFVRLQIFAVQNLGSSIAERYYAGASRTPAQVMGRLFQGASFHLAAASGGVAENFRKDFEELAAALGSEFPRALSLEAQGRFALGYYHQRAEYRRLSEERRERQNSQRELAQADLANKNPQPASIHEQAHQ